MRIEKDPNLKWCPQNYCVGVAKRKRGFCCGWKSIAICQTCNMTMCFKCGAVEHPGTSCNSVGNAELRNYVKQFNVQKCPNCGFGTQKIDGCNHMTCAKCWYNWCWLCRGRHYSGHYNEMNIFGCPGDQYSKDNSCLNIIKKILLIIFTPIILFGFGFAGTCAIFIDLRCFRRSNCVAYVLLFAIFIIPFALLAGTLCTIASPFAILFQFFLLIKIIWNLIY